MTVPAPSEPAPIGTVSLGEALPVWARIGLLSFGGPAGQIALMHRVLIEEKRWIDEPRFLHALNYCMLLPGPEATQLAVYIGWLLHGTRGGLAAGFLFVLPGIVAMLALSALYVGYRDLAWVEVAFLGVKAAVLAIVLEAVARIGRRILKNGVMVAIAAAAFVAIFALDLPFPLIVAAAGLTGFLGGRYAPERFIVGARPGGAAQDAAALPLAGVAPSATRTVKIAAIWLAIWFAPLALVLVATGGASVFMDIGLFFSKLAVVTFGGAYAVLAYMAQQAVEAHGWLAPGEMLDGLGLAETTPGPLIMVTQFVGFLAAFRAATGLDPWLAGILGALLTTWVTFAPSFMAIFVGAPHVERLRGNPGLNAALSAITAAVVGVILNLAIWFGLHVVFARVEVWEGAGLRLLIPELWSLSWPALLLSALAVLALFRFHLGVAGTLALTAGLALVLYLAGFA
jgi:chromate transporter